MKKRNYLKSTELQPRIKFARTKFDLSYEHKTAFNLGDLVPVYLQEIYPGDTFDLNAAYAMRTTVPFVRVPMDNIFVDTFYFFVPHRIVYNRWPEVLGENNNGYWAPASMPEVPKATKQIFTTDVKKKYMTSIANYFGLPYDSMTFNVSDLPFRAYALIWNEWFRDENTQEPVNINFGDNKGVVAINNEPFGVNNYHGQCAKVNKLHDYFTSCLPAPQKGEAINIPMEEPVPVYTGASHSQTSPVGLGFNNSTGNPITGTGTLGLAIGETGFLQTSFTPTEGGIYPNNLYADVNLGNINDLRFAFQLQKMLEKDARGGTRYVEYLQAHFGVTTPDARFQRPEFLGGKRNPLSMQQVTQTSASTDTSPLGQVSAYSLSNGSSGYSKGFVEHGFVIGVCCARQYHTYQQGIDKMWLRFKKTDFYDRLFSTLGEQPVYNYELDASGQQIEDANVFGYNEYGADLRYRRNIVTGALNSTLGQGFDVWHFGDYYDSSSAPHLDSDFMQETPAYLDRCLSAPSTTVPNFIIDFAFKQTAIRVMPAYSIPGYVDHH